MNANKIDTEAIVDRILESKKYRDSGLNRETVRDLVFQESPHQPSSKKLIKSVKRKLHNIVAPYLGEPDYSSLKMELVQISTEIPDSSEVKAFCKSVLSKHASTRERIPIIEEFYERLFEHTGKPNTLLDLACGMHPFAFPWMGLPPSVQYHAYDIIQPRIDFINNFFNQVGLQPLAENRDVLVNPPEIEADMALIFKEAHRMEKRQPGCNKALWESLSVKILAVSLPVQNLAGTHSLLEKHRELVYSNLPYDRRVEELILEDEIVFLIREV